QIVQFTWAPASAPVQPSSSLSSGTPDYGPVYVTVYLNDTPYTTFPAISGTVSGVSVLNGSFIAPNAQPGSYWAVSFGWSQYVNKSSGHVNGYVTYVGKSAMYLGLVSGNGALLTGITPSEVAQLELAINSTLTTEMQIPLSELNAAVTAIEGTSATISTSFGTMEASLSALNATVNSISNGIATIKTSLGTVNASLMDINASIASVNGNLVMIKTTAGYVNTTLNSLVPEIKSIMNGIVTIQTMAGNINYNLTSFSNLEINAINNNAMKITGKLNGMNVSFMASLSAINGTVKSTASSVSSLVGSSATIQTDLGTITG
ncbi:MAG: hypothetical protein ACP5MB_11480, partial [bacterium]